jgi:cyclohexa-1,5-dienecarbonyl-CoA hydratase
MVDEFGRIAYGEPKTGAALDEGKALMKRGTVDLSLLDAQGRGAVRQDAADLPRLHDQDDRGAAQAQARRLEPQQGNSRAWLALNMMTEARSGFTAFNEGTKDDREVDFVLLRQKLAAGQSWVGALHDEIQPQGAPAWLKLPWATGASPLKAWLERDGALLRLRLARPKANIVDAQMIGALHAALDAHGRARALRGVLLDAEGPHFSFGASVEEHLADRCARCWPRLHALILAMVDFPAPILVAVRGQCLGGGLEVALAGGPIFAAPTRSSASPRSSSACSRRRPRCLLPWRVNRRRRRGPAVQRPQHRRRRGAWPSAWCRRWPTTPRRPRWPGSTNTCAAQRRRAGLRAAAARAPRLRELRERLAEVERLYLDTPDEATRDANEGLAPSSPSAHPSGSTADERHPTPRESRIVQRCEALFEDLTSTPSRPGRPPCRAARRSATCRCTCRAS